MDKLQRKKIKNLSKAAERALLPGQTARVDSSGKVRIWTPINNLPSKTVSKEARALFNVDASRRMSRSKGSFGKRTRKDKKVQYTKEQAESILWMISVWMTCKGKTPDAVEKTNTGDRLVYNLTSGLDSNISYRVTFTPSWRTIIRGIEINKDTGETFEKKLPTYHFK